MRCISWIFLVLLCVSAEAKVVGKSVEYIHDGKVMEGYLAFDNTKGKGSLRPGVLVVHEWTGIGPYVKKRVDQMASLGYIAFAPDIYGKGVRPMPPEAGKVAESYKSNRTLLRARALAGLAELSKNPMVDKSRIGAMGYCFGGTTVLELARAGADLKAVVSFHGGLSTPNPDDAKSIKGSVLVLHGAYDPYVPDAEVSAFENEMRSAKVDWQLIKYANAVHSFTNPDAGNDPAKGAAYHESSDKRSWEAMRDFFLEKLGG